MSARAEWLKERGSIPGVGASESAALFGLHPQISAFSLFEKLTNPRPLTDEQLEEDADVKSFGLAIEPYLSDWYQRKTGRCVNRPAELLYRLDESRPYIFASPDRFYLDKPNVSGVLELKSAIYFSESEPLPDHWQVQLQHQCLVIGVPAGSFAILGGFRRRYHVDDVPANPAFQEILIETIDRFMQAVRLGSWAAWGGDIEGSKATREALRRLYPQDKGTVVQLPAEASSGIVELPGTKERRVYVGWADRRDKVKRAIKTLEAIESELDNKLRAAIGEHSYGVLQDGSAFSLKVTKGSTYTVTKEDYRTLRRVKALPKGLTA